MAIKWTKQDVINKVQEAMNPIDIKTSNRGTLDRLMARVKRPGEVATTVPEAKTGVV